MTEQEFYNLRDDRSGRAMALGTAPTRPVAIFIDSTTSSTLEGQTCLMALLNMAARFHRVIHIDVPPVPLVARSIVPERQLERASHALAKAINPFVRLEPSFPEDAISIGIGPTSAKCWCSMAWSGCTGNLLDGTHTSTIEGGMIGACIAACLGAGALFHAAFDHPTKAHSVSLLPASAIAVQSESQHQHMPVEVGRVLQVGAGGVGSCLAYWLYLFDLKGDWLIVDRDPVTIGNLNRCLPFLFSHVGQPKAPVLGQLLDVRSKTAWYDELQPPELECDLTLPLANERGFRRIASLRGDPIQIHATTAGLAREAQLHRHICGRDDCIACRMSASDDRQPALACAQSTIPTADGHKAEAALPFLSAAAGLMLAVALHQLQGGQLATGLHNGWVWRFHPEHPGLSPRRHACGSECERLPASAYSGLPPTRWSHLRGA